MTYQFHRVGEVALRFAVCESMIHRWAKLGLLPPPIKIGPRFAAWPGHELDAIAEARIAGHGDDKIRELVTAIVEQRTKKAA